MEDTRSLFLRIRFTERMGVGKFINLSGDAHCYETGSFYLPKNSY